MNTPAINHSDAVMGRNAFTVDQTDEYHRITTCIPIINNGTVRNNDNNSAKS